MWWSKEHEHIVWRPLQGRGAFRDGGTQFEPLCLDFGGAILLPVSLLNNDCRSGAVEEVGCRDLTGPLWCLRALPALPPQSLSAHCGVPEPGHLPLRGPHTKDLKP